MRRDQTAGSGSGERLQFPGQGPVGADRSGRESRLTIDPHCHLDDPLFGARLEQVLEEALTAGVGGAIIPSYGPDRWERQGELLRAPRDFALWGGFGLHPWAVDPSRDVDYWRGELEAGWRKAQSWGDRLKAVGEFGLDRSGDRASVPLPLQREVFEWHLGKAREVGLPVILHLVRVDGLALEILGRDAPWNGVVHGFSGHRDSVPRYLEMGLSLSFGRGLLRYDKARDALRATPHDRLMFETDLTRGGPADLIEIVAAASQILGKSVEYVLARHRENCARVFGLVYPPEEQTKEERADP